MRNHRGFTLVEILISIVIMGLVTGSIYTLLNTTQRVSRAQAERTELQSNIRSGTIIVPAELREIAVTTGGGVPKNDIISMSATSIRYRAMRGFGYTCQAPTTGQIILFGGSKFSGYRTPVANRDSAYVFIEGADADHGTDDSWLAVPITGVNTAANACPGGAASITLTVNPLVPGLDKAFSYAPVRTWEEMILQLYVDGSGESWLGAQSVSTAGDAMQPVLGPLTSADGFGLTYLDSTGVATAATDKVRSIQVTLKGLTDQAITQGTSAHGLANRRDSLVTQVTLRNALR
jgi:prepilin-type N-terminal cleavage/methylation domain-containing protein